jgi:hypothetical protein
LRADVLLKKKKQSERSIEWSGDSSIERTLSELTRDRRSRKITRGGAEGKFFLYPDEFTRRLD